jgi:hypothetical protein
MREIEPGHIYELASYDGAQSNIITYVKREGALYPGNIGAHPGTLTQESLRADAARLSYVNQQEPCNETSMALWHVRQALMLLEMRAKRKRGQVLPPLDIRAIEHIDSCRTCGHILCKEH